MIWTGLPMRNGRIDWLDTYATADSSMAIESRSFYPMAPEFMSRISPANWLASSWSASARAQAEQNSFI